MKRIIAIALVLVMLLSLTACANTAVLYKKTNFDKIVELPEYKNIKLDKQSEQYKAYYQNVIDSDVKTNSLYTQKTDGYVADGDIVNIDYVGTMDGVAFEGGTASDYTLTVGSGSFIDGFESGLIGSAVGSTVTLNLTFPDPYENNLSLSGKPVVFTVKINYVQSTEGFSAEVLYKKLGYKSLEAYEDNIELRAIENYIIGEIVNNAKIKEYPEEEKNLMLESYKKRFETSLKEDYQTDFATYLKSVDKTEEEFDDAIVESTIKPLMKYQIPIYAILKKEGMKITKSDIDKKIDDLIEQSGNPAVEHEDLRNQYGDYYFEYLLAGDMVIQFIKEKADIK